MPPSRWRQQTDLFAVASSPALPQSHNAPSRTVRDLDLILPTKCYDRSCQ